MVYTARIYARNIVIVMQINQIGYEHVDSILNLVYTLDTTV